MGGILDGLSAVEQVVVLAGPSITSILVVIAAVVGAFGLLKKRVDELKDDTSQVASNNKTLSEVNKKLVEENAQLKKENKDLKKRVYKLRN